MRMPVHCFFVLACAKEAPPNCAPVHWFPGVSTWQIKKKPQYPPNLSKPQRKIYVTETWRNWNVETWNVRNGACTKQLRPSQKTEKTLIGTKMCHKNPQKPYFCIVKMVRSRDGSAQEVVLFLTLEVVLFSNSWKAKNVVLKLTLQHKTARFGGLCVKTGPRVVLKIGPSFSQLFQIL